ncbi:hypothetical protein [Devosia sp.]|uniref:hypothetical protein n=1 Tax=Devosia sp. TaxID=1871048 RepID=UPI003A94D63F
MRYPFRKALLLSTATFALIAAPVLLNATPVSDITTVAAGNDKGKSSKSKGSSKSKSSSSSSKSGGASGKSKSAASRTASVGVEAKGGKQKNIHAQLAGLNSLKRNINGLMNSSDPRMVQLRSYVANSAALEIATRDLIAAQTDLGAAVGAFDSYVDATVTNAGLVAYDGSGVYNDPSVSDLQARQAELSATLANDPANAAAQAEYDALNATLQTIASSAELEAIRTQQGVISGLESDIAGYQSLTTEDSLRAALLAAANDNRMADAGGDAYLTPEIMNWAEQTLGVGDSRGLIDAYVAQQ